MTQSKNDDFYTITVDNDTIDLSGILDTTGDVTINLDTIDMNSTTYWAGDSITDITVSGVDAGTYTLDTNDTIDIGWIYNNMNINPDEVERMCKEYPSLEKVWRNFKSVYDMVKQDYEGKKKAGEIDDDDELPF